MLRLGILKVGYIYPKEERSLRDLLRKRSQMVRQRTTQMLSIQNLYARNSAERKTANQVRNMVAADIDQDTGEIHLNIRVLKLALSHRKHTHPIAHMGRFF
jgi:transposase